MHLSRIHHYLIREVFAPTLLCLLVFTVVLLMGRLMKLVDLVVNKGVSIFDILILFGAMLPTFLNITLPLAFLMGIMIGLSRMSADSETVALKAAGVGLVEIARPVIAMALIFSILTAVAGLWLKPWGYQAFRQQLFEITMKKATIGIKPKVFMQQFSNMVLYVNDINDRSGEMKGLFIVEEKPDASTLIFADQGTILSDEAAGTVSFRLKNGTIHRQENGSDAAYQLVHFRSYDVQPNLTGEQGRAEKQRARTRPKEMTSHQLWDQIEVLKRAPQEAELYAARAELHARLTAPLAPLLFAIFGLPFSIQSQRSGRSGGFVIGLIIYLCYYVFTSTAQTLTADAGVIPAVSFWAPHGLLVACGLYFLYQCSRERPNRLVAALEQILMFLKARTKKLDEHS